MRKTQASTNKHNYLATYNIYKNQLYIAEANTENEMLKYTTYNSIKYPGVNLRKYAKMCATMYNINYKTFSK